MSNVLLGAKEDEAELVQRLRVTLVDSCSIGLGRSTELLENQATELVVALRTGFGSEPNARHFKPIKQSEHIVASIGMRNDAVKVENYKNMYC